MALKDAITISDYLDESLVAFLDVKQRNEAIQELVDLLDHQKKLINKEIFFQAVLEREKIVSTGIGISVAIPHAKMAGYKDFFIAIGIVKHQGIEWSAIDGLPVRIIFLIGGPDHEQTKYLKILSLITQTVKDDSRRKKLIKATSAKEVIEIFRGF